MNITIFESVTTEKALQEIELESVKYDGLYVEMSEGKERKFVKDKASEINEILKNLDRTRIDISKKNKIKVEDEARLIRDRLEAANKPFTLLIDDYAIVRAKQITKEKELQAAKDLAFQMPIDHAEAVLLNRMFDFEKAEKIREQKERDEEIARKATEDAERKLSQAKIDAENAEKQRIKDVEYAKECAKQAEINRQELEKQDEADRIKKLEDNKKHVALICGQSKDDLIKKLGIDELTAKLIVTAIRDKDIRNLSINY